jgi:HK97 family phage major capsid protein
MKQFIRPFMEPETKTGGFTPEEKTELQAAIKSVEEALAAKNKSAINEAIKEHVTTINESLKKFADWKTEKDETDQKNQKALDELLTKMKDSQKGLQKAEVRSFHQAFVEELTKPENLKGLDRLRKGERFRMEIPGFVDMTQPSIFSTVTNHGMKRGESEFDRKMASYEQKTVGDMTQSANLTGDPVATYSGRQVILPAQKVNFRDLIPTVRSETGLYVQYKETGGEGGIGLQTEGSGKSQIDYDFTEVKTVSKYIAGFARFSKQLRRNLPFLQGTLPRLLQRDFFKAENRHFYDMVATAATTYSLSTETDDVKQLMDQIGQQMQNDFMASYSLMSWIAMTRLNKLLYSNGYYQGAGGALSQPDGSIRISGVPVVPVTWIPTNDKSLVFDNDYIERVEVEGLAIEFFEQDGNNVTENKITARIECFEEINPMLGASILLMDFGNSSSS